MNLHYLLLCSLSTAVAIPFNSNSMFLDLDRQPNLLAGASASETDNHNPSEFSQDASPGSADFTLATPDHSIVVPPPTNQLEQNDANTGLPVQGSAAGEYVCCERKRGADRQVCRRCESALSDPVPQD